MKRNIKNSVKAIELFKAHKTFINGEISVTEKTCFVGDALLAYRDAIGCVYVIGYSILNDVVTYKRIKLNQDRS